VQLIDAVYSCFKIGEWCVKYVI